MFVRTCRHAYVCTGFGKQRYYDEIFRGDGVK